MTRMKLKTDRFWLLRSFQSGVWTCGAPMLLGIKKWDDHRAALEKMGLLAVDPERPRLNRITEQGLKVLGRVG